MTDNMKMGAPKICAMQRRSVKIRAWVVGPAIMAIAFLVLVGIWISGQSTCSIFGGCRYFAPPADLLNGWQPEEADLAEKSRTAIAASHAVLSEDGGTTSVDLPPQKLTYWIDDHGMPVEGQPPARWVWHVSMTVSSKAWITRNSATQKPCFYAAPAKIRQVWTDTSGKEWPEPDFAAGSLEVRFVPAVDRPVGSVDGCFSGLSMPAYAANIVRIDGRLTWYKAPDHTFSWTSDLSFPPLQ